MSAAPPDRVDPTHDFVEVALDVPLHTAFTYRVPDALRGAVTRGVRVLVPFRQHSVAGVVLRSRESAPEVKRMRSIADVVDATPAVPDPQLALLEWAARYYHAPVGECVHLALPGEASFRSTRWVEAVDGDPAVPDAVTEDEHALLVALREASRPLSPADAIALTGARHYHLDALEAHALIRTIVRNEGTKQRAKTDERVTLLRGGTLSASQRRLGETQERVLGYMKRHREALASEVRHQVGCTTATLRSLAKRGVIAMETIEVTRDPFARADITPRTEDPTLTPQQAEGLERLQALEPGQTALLHGVTGSGKTELYVRLVRAAVERSERALVLLPEIALTPQLVAVFRAAVRAPIAVLHSGLTPGERFDQWRRIRAGEVSVVIGARSALFAPIADLGLIVVDEEHDPSFKQSTGVTYHARDLAVLLARRSGARCVLGTATPSLESLHNARAERYAYVSLPERVTGRPLPQVEIIDMRDHAAADDDPVGAILSVPLQQAVREAVRAGEQAILFLNRRGFAPSVQCNSCGTVLECPSCDVPVTYHHARRGLRCHYCGFESDLPKTCPTCGSDELEHRGAGTEQIEDIVDSAFKGLRVGRLDRDTARGQGLQRVLGQFRRRELDVLVGTQMVTKGHDFPSVTLVGVVDADQGLRFPDFRSGERTFQLVAQVAGRAGRGELPGRVLVQTWRPEHAVLQAIASHDFDAMAARELRFRERLDYPPFGSLSVVRLDAPEYGHVTRAAEEIAKALRKHGPSELRVQGPVDAPIARVRNRFRVHVVLRSVERRAVRRGIVLAHQVREHFAKAWQKQDVRAHVDVDAQSLL